MLSSTTGLPSSVRDGEIIPMDEPEEQVNTRPAPKFTSSLDQWRSLDVQKQLNRVEVNKAVDIRMPTTALLTINSADRYQPYSLASRSNNPGNANAYTLTSPADFTISVPQNIMNGYFTRIAVQQISMVFFWPYICNATNGIYINWQPGGTGAVTQYLITVPNSANSIPGSPANSTLANGLQIAIRAATGSSLFTVTSNGFAQTVFGFESKNTDKFYFSRWTSPVGPNAFTLFDALGISAQCVLATSLVGNMNFTTLRTPYIDIVCEQITANQSLRDASSTTGAGRTLLSRVYIQPENGNNSYQQSYGNTGAFIQKTYSLPKQISWPANQPLGGSLRIQLLDAQGYVLTCGANYNDVGGNLGMMTDANMGDWSMVLQVSEL